MDRSRRKLLKATGVGITGGLLSGCQSTGDTNGTEEPGSDGSANDNQSPVDENEVTEWSAGGSSEGSPANAWVEGFAATIENNSDKLRLNPRLSPGWLAAAVRVSTGDLDLSMADSIWSFLAHRDQGPFADDGEVGPLDPKPQSTLPPIHVPTVPFVTYSDRDDIETVYDFDGKRVGLDVEGGGISRMALRIFDTADIDVDVEFLSFPEVASALDSERVDAQLVVVINNQLIPGPYAPQFETVGLKYVDIPEELREATKQDHPFIEIGPISGEELVNVEPPEPLGDGQGIVIPSTMLVRENADPDLVYELTSVVLDNQDDLGQYHAALNAFGFGDERHNFKGVADGTPFHEGAIRYYEEQDIDYPTQP